MEYLAHGLEPYNLKLIVIKQKVFELYSACSYMFQTSKHQNVLVFLIPTKSPFCLKLNDK